ncbi:TPA: hypothetical protein ACIZSP_001877 [Streptococcus agalactiae]
MTLYFPDVTIDNFDPDGDWLIQAMNDDLHTVSYLGQGINQGLRLVTSYQMDPDYYDSLSVGELVKLPRELLMGSDDDPSIDEIF